MRECDLCGRLLDPSSDDEIVEEWEGDGLVHADCLDEEMLRAEFAHLSDADLLAEAGTLLGLSVRAVETVRDPQGRVA